MMPISEGWIAQPWPTLSISPMIKSSPPVEILSRVKSAADGFRIPRTFFADDLTSGRDNLMAQKTTRPQHRSEGPAAHLTDLSRIEGVTQIWTRPLEACLRWQAEMLKATEPMATGWF